MGKRKTNYSSDWEKRYTLIKNVKKDASLAFCKLCEKTFRTDGGGISSDIACKWTVTFKT